MLFVKISRYNQGDCNEKQTKFFKSKFTLIIIFILFLLGSIFFIFNFNENSKPYPKEDIIDTNNLFIVNEIKSYLEILDDSNFEYNFNIKSNENIYNYNGIRYDKNYKGVYNYLDKNINYQIEDNVCYDLNTKKEIFNVHIAYIEFDYISDILVNENTKCARKKELYECNSINNSDEIKLQFFIKDNNLSNIEIANEKNNYELKYFNINKVSAFEKINEFVRFKTFYDESEYNDSQTIEDFGTFNLYKISNIKYILKNESNELNYTTLDEFLSQALYKIEKHNSVKYFYENGLIIYIVKNSINLRDVYVSLEKYNNEILNQINEKSK